MGKHIDVSHNVATPFGLDETAEVDVIEVDRKRMVFDVKVHDGIDVVFAGRHVRIVIQRDKFGGKLQSKIPILQTAEL